MLQLLRRAPRAARAASPRCLEPAKTRRFALSFSPRLWTGAGRRAFSDQVSPADQSVASASPVVSEIVPSRPAQEQPQQITRTLPIVCPGCGAHSQTVESNAAGFYGEKRSKRHAAKVRAEEEDRILTEAFESGAIENPSSATEPLSAITEGEAPVCDRCHKLHHYRTGTSIVHPSMQSIQSIIEESPHKHNHIYHVVDAADFPLSLIPNLQDALQLPKLRTQNRRSKNLHYIRGRVAEVSFIITRSDLLAPKKEQVDTLMPYLQDCLRDALGRSGQKLRLGNVRCVSAQRGWWTKNVKEDIWKRGGAGWMVGKANVGKSALFEAVFPKGRNQEVSSPDKLRRKEQIAAAVNYADRLDVGINDALGGETPPTTLEQEQGEKAEPYQESELELNEKPENNNEDEDVLLDEDSLLPPVQPLTAYPRMPLISALPGTTASPIRIPFGNGSKGELVDLPGIARSSLDTHVQPEHHSDLIMHSRVVPEQQTLKPSQSLLLGGLIRITPKTSEQIFLAYAFMPKALSPHTTATDRAIAIQTGVNPETQEPYAGTVSTVATDAAKEKIASAGSFKLAWDVTKRRAGPLTRSDAGKQKAETLPFHVYSADILIEGVGWVELVAQVRKKRVEAAESASQDPFRETEADDATPEVEIFSPKGKYVGIRRPMNAWLLGGPKKGGKQTKGRGRMSIGFEKRKAGGKLSGRPKEMAD